jgi:4'-phosphopantetheinyl transferase
MNGRSEADRIETVVWCVDVGPSRAEELAHRYLSAEERERAARFLREESAVQFIAARAGLRRVLGEALGCAPHEIELILDEKGKPRLCPRAHATGLHFNLTHSHALAAVALARGHVVGIDIEWHDPARDLLRLARRYFRGGEIRAVEQPGDAPARCQAFYRCWTRKEAWLKATGDGLRFPTRRFEVTADPAPSARLLVVEGRPGEEHRWRLEDIPVPAGYSGTVVAPTGNWTIAYRELEGLR